MYCAEYGNTLPTRRDPPKDIRIEQMGMNNIYRLAAESTQEVANDSRVIQARPSHAFEGNSYFPGQRVGMAQRNNPRAHSLRLLGTNQLHQELLGATYRKVVDDMNYIHRYATFKMPGLRHSRN